MSHQAISLRRGYRRRTKNDRAGRGGVPRSGSFRATHMISSRFVARRGAIDVLLFSRLPSSPMCGVTCMIPSRGGSGTLRRTNGSKLWTFAPVDGDLAHIGISGDAEPSTGCGGSDTQFHDESALTRVQGLGVPSPRSGPAPGSTARVMESNRSIRRHKRPLVVSLVGQLPAAQGFKRVLREGWGGF